MHAAHATSAFLGKYLTRLEIFILLLSYKYVYCKHRLLMRPYIRLSTGQNRDYYMLQNCRKIYCNSSYHHIIRFAYITTCILSIFA